MSDEIGVKKAAEQLGVLYYTLTDWWYATLPRHILVVDIGACRWIRGYVVRRMRLAKRGVLCMLRLLMRLMCELAV